jgi:hypothetical protein
VGVYTGVGRRAATRRLPPALHEASASTAAVRIVNLVCRVKLPPRPTGSKIAPGRADYRLGTDRRNSTGRHYEGQSENPKRETIH